MLTAEQVRAKRFAVTRFREGYDQQEVDAFLERAATALEREGALGAMTAEEATRVRFSPSRFSLGYDQDEVDDYLDDIIASLGAPSGTASLGGEEREALSAAGVRGKRFAVTRFREGYDQREVDALLERAAITLDRPDAPERVTAAEVVHVRFRPTTFSAGYDQDEVDDFLDELATTLRALPGRSSPVPPLGQRGWSDAFFGPDDDHLTADPPKAVRQLGPNGPRLRLWEAQLLGSLQHGRGPVTGMLCVAVYLVVACAASYVAVDTAWWLMSGQPSTPIDPGPSPWDAFWWLAAALGWLLVSVSWRWTAWLIRRRRGRDG